MHVLCSRGTVMNTATLFSPHAVDQMICHRLNVTGQTVQNNWPLHWNWRELNCLFVCCSHQLKRF